VQKLYLNHDSLLKGKFTLSRLNFLFVFQVNCPGCFLYGIPLVNKLYHEFKDEISFLGLSTAFEDFKYNNIQNTELLLFKNEIVGETKKTLKSQGIKKNPSPIEFPVAMDTKATKKFNYENGAEKICQINPNYNAWPEFEKSSLKTRVINYLKNQDICSLTFTLNQLKGTPTMLVFNDKHEILFHQFGHIDFNTIKLKLEELINLSNKYD